MSDSSKKWKYGDSIPPVFGPKNNPNLGDNNKSMMDAVKAQLNKYREPLLTGALAVVLGFGARKLMKSDHISTGSLRQAGMSFALVSIAGVAAQEMSNRYK